MVSFELTHHDLDEVRLTGTVNTDHSHTGGKGALDRDINELRVGGSRVLKVDILGFQDSLSERLDTLERSWLREGESDEITGQLVVSLGLSFA